VNCVPVSPNWKALPTRTKTMTEERGVWLYAVTRRLDPDVLVSLPGVSAEKPRIVAAAGLAAVVGDVPLSAFGEEALRRNFEDLDWLAGVARAHDAVIAAVVRQGPAVPVRLATVYRDDDRVRQVLERRAADFTSTLARLTGRIEWGVKVFLEAVPADDVVPRQESGTAYLARRRATMTAQERHERRAIEQTDRVHCELSRLAADARSNASTAKPGVGQRRRTDAPQRLLSRG
jgi:hypothetical protein